MILACQNRPGSLYDTLKHLREREISYAQFTQSYGALPGLAEGLEMQRFDFDRRSHQEIAGAGEVKIPRITSYNVCYTKLLREELLGQIVAEHPEA